MSVFRNVVVSVCIAGGMAGCSSVTYTPPTEGPLADVRFAFEGLPGSESLFGPAHFVEVIHYDDTECTNRDSWLAISEFGSLNDPERNLGIPLNTYKKSAAKEIRVAANTEHTFLLKSGTSQPNGMNTLETNCGVFVTKTFEPGRQYEFLFTEPATNQCTLRVSEIVGTGDMARRVAEETFTNDATDVSDSCRKAFEYVPLW